ncbi:hypothetical protein BKA56DRAFT_636916 [Ilyonectria sp. MPI-CAGE-AT-0026]|nr:hypothetical protein BKA56DRAFT_636916 [Ilyonectria sp. MPI-CAGE-AT-0026]
MSSTPPDGVFVPVPTFFYAEAKAPALQPAVNFPTQVAYSLVLMGSTSEAVHLSGQERFDMVSGVRKGLDDAGYEDYPIMAGVLVNNVDEVLEWLHDAHKAVAQWGLVLAPGYFGTASTQDNLIEWDTLVADRSPLPILIYNYPGSTNNLVVDVNTYVTLPAHPNIVGSKRPLDEPTLEELRRLQWKVSAAEEFIVNHSILGIREGIYKELGFGHLSGGRLPLKGALAVGAFEECNGILGQMAEEEKRL